MKKYAYYWYHHMMPEKEREEIFQAIKDKDYFRFIELYKKYNILAIRQGTYSDEFESWSPMTYLPDGISVWDTEKEECLETIYILDKENFMKITHTECECG